MKGYMDLQSDIEKLRRANKRLQTLLIAAVISNGGHLWIDSKALADAGSYLELKGNFPAISKCEDASGISFDMPR